MQPLDPWRSGAVVLDSILGLGTSVKGKGHHWLLMDVELDYSDDYDDYDDYYDEPMIMIIIIIMMFMIMMMIIIIMVT